MPVSGWVSSGCQKGCRLHAPTIQRSEGKLRLVSASSDSPTPWASHRMLAVRDQPGGAPSQLSGREPHQRVIDQRRFGHEAQHGLRSGQIKRLHGGGCLPSRRWAGAAGRQHLVSRESPRPGERADLRVNQSCFARTFIGLVLLPKVRPVARQTDGARYRPGDCASRFAHDPSSTKVGPCRDGVEPPQATGPGWSWNG